MPRGTGTMEILTSGDGLTLGDRFEAVQRLAKAHRSLLATVWKGECDVH